MNTLTRYEYVRIGPSTFMVEDDDEPVGVLHVYSDREFLAGTRSFTRRRSAARYLAKENRRLKRRAQRA